MIDNVNRVLEFKIDGYTVARRLIPYEVTNIRDELNIASPVGEALRTMPAGEEKIIDTPVGPMRVRLIRVIEGA